MIEMKFVSASEAVKMIKTGKLVHLLSIAGILYYLNDRIRQLAMQRQYRSLYILFTTEVNRGLFFFLG